MTGYRPMTLADLAEPSRTDHVTAKSAGSWCGSSSRSTAGSPPTLSSRSCTTSRRQQAMNAGTRCWPRWPSTWPPAMTPPRRPGPSSGCCASPWFPAELRVQRADALVWAPAAFRKHGVYLSARDLEAA